MPLTFISIHPLFLSSSSELEMLKIFFLQFSPLSPFNHFKASVWLIIAEEWCHYLISLLKNTHSIDSPLFSCIKSFPNLCLHPYSPGCPTMLADALSADMQCSCPLVPLLILFHLLLLTALPLTTSKFCSALWPNYNSISKYWTI